MVPSEQWWQYHYWQLQLTHSTSKDVHEDDESLLTSQDCIHPSSICVEGKLFASVPPPTLAKRNARQWKLPLVIPDVNIPCQKWTRKWWYPCSSYVCTRECGAVAELPLTEPPRRRDSCKPLRTVASSVSPGNWNAFLKMIIREKHHLFMFSCFAGILSAAWTA